ncbi:MAG: hypothetical protein LBK99_11940, partial [Opitutaceae bacterium]|nr:hypothetical protein [Opitutaceae bacterium]
TTGEDVGVAFLAQGVGDGFRRERHGGTGIAAVVREQVLRLFPGGEQRISTKGKCDQQGGRAQGFEN